MSYATAAVLCLLAGALFIGGGGALTTWGWSHLSSRARRTLTIAVIIGGSVFIAIGGVLTTAGWTKWSAHSQKRTLIVALGREWVCNFTAVTGEPFVFKDAAEIGKGHVVYPTLSTSCGEAILVSPLFDFEGSVEEKGLIDAVFNLKQNTARLNKMLALLDAELWMKGVTAERRAKRYAEVKRGPLFQIFWQYHLEVGRILLQRYPWSLPADARKNLEAIGWAN